MTWFKVDDSFYDHPKVEALSLSARGLWVTAGSYAARHLTNGFVPENIIKRVGKGVAAGTRELCSQGLWRVVPGGIQFHDWEDFQPSRESVETERLRTKERQSAWRERNRNGVTNASRNGVTNSARRDVAPTRPDHKPPYPPDAAPSPPSADRSSATADGDFETFWQTYPRKADEAKARAAWRRATSDTAATVVLAGLDLQLETLRATEAQFIPKPDTWLRNQRWTDEPAEPEPDPWAHMTVINPRPENWRELLEAQTSSERNTR